MTNQHIWDNAKKLIGDAKLLAEHGRYESAIALSALSAEEIGKFYLLKQPSKPADLRSHRAKQEVFGRLLMGAVAFRQVDIFLERHGLELRHRSKMTQRQAAALETDIFRQLNESFFSHKIRDAATGEPLIEILAKSLYSTPMLGEIMSGKLNDLKLVMLYVDAENAPTHGDPDKLKSDCYVIIEHVESLISTIDIANHSNDTAYHEYLKIVSIG